MVRPMTGTAIITGWKRTALAGMLAYALALQGVLLALGGAMHVQAATLPETVLCLSDGQGGSPHQPGQTDHALCCILSCGVSVASAGPVPVTASLQPLQPRQPLPIDLRPTVGASPRAIALNVLPVGSRAPPRLG
ncbi:hypothetical protein [Microvirga brassicacearum]|uniref:DUF2946 domain-containing protein n=1 Tax=Microvirga brassicacearum TaxID=2580413 RepID=A0A5N3PEA5_9HYPH|nr:hypothetical protein [Microvirga brassicacearum]KAB0268087.1 hypothetical protein FEZ63_06440 [Microvirga brassicacearum]